MKFIFQIILATFTAGCVKATAQDEYSVEDVSVLEYTMEGQELTLTYQTSQESLYFSPGVKVKRESEGVFLNVVRCGIKGKCEVDSAAKFNDGSQLSVVRAVARTTRKALSITYIGMPS